MQAKTTLIKKRSVLKGKKFQEINRRLIEKSKSERNLLNQLAERGKLFVDINVKNTKNKRGMAKYKMKAQSLQQVIVEKSEVIHTLTSHRISSHRYTHI